jgi:hypothetical protein
MRRTTVLRLIAIRVLALLSACLIFLVACGSEAARTNPAPQAGVEKQGSSAATSGAASGAVGSASVPEDGAFIKAPGEDALYIVENGRKRLFTDWATFQAWGGRPDFGNMNELPRDQFDSIPTGEPIPTGSRPPAPGR